MGKVQVKFTEQFSDDLADLVYFIESTAQNYANKVYDFIGNLDFEKINYPFCREPIRAEAGLKCLRFNRKYALVFYQFENEIIITEFIPFKLLVF